MKLGLKLLIGLSLAGLAGAGIQKVSLRRHHLSFVPPALEATEILYVAEEAWGIGPGANETGIIVYAMPEAAAGKIEVGGQAFLEGLEGSRGWRGRYRDWHATPFDPTVRGAFDIWAQKAHDQSCNHGGGIAAYMFRYTVCIPFDPKWEALANDALASPGSYYAFGRIGMLMLIPSENRIIYAYNG